MPLPQEKRYTYADLKSWDGPERYELIDGELYMLAAPNPIHQIISVDLTRQIATYLLGKKCRLFSAPIDVRLFEGKDDNPNHTMTVLQPDLMINCDPSRIDKHGCKGAPDMVVEILSPSTQKRDFLEKFQLYQRAGVKEYWLVDPDKKTILVCVLKNGVLVIDGFYEQNDTVKVNVLDNCTVDLSTVFDY